mgnify:CR=1 FL=1
MNTPQNNETFSDEMGNIFKKTSNLTNLITMIQEKNNILLDQTMETPEE